MDGFFYRAVMGEVFGVRLPVAELEGLVPDKAKGGTTEKLKRGKQKAEQVSSLFTLRKELADEACGIRLYGRIRPSVEKLRCAAWSNGVGVGEITAQVIHCFHRDGIGEQRTQFRRHVRDSASIIPQQVEQVVGVLVFPPEVEGERLDRLVKYGDLSKPWEKASIRTDPGTGLAVSLAKESRS